MLEKGIIILFSIVGTLFAVVLALRIRANAQRLRRGIQEFKEEQAELARQGKAQDPYAALAEIYDQSKHSHSKPDQP